MGDKTRTLLKWGHGVNLALSLKQCGSDIDCTFCLTITFSTFHLEYPSVLCRFCIQPFTHKFVDNKRWKPIELGHEAKGQGLIFFSFNRILWARYRL